MKKKMKGLLSVGLCLAVGLSVGSLVACNNNNNDSTTPGEKSEYYVCGTFTDKALTSGWNPIATLDEVPEANALMTTETKGVYTITLSLWAEESDGNASTNGDGFEGFDQFKILQVGKNWNFKVTGKRLDPDREDEDLKGGGGMDENDWNIQCMTSGKYKFTVKIGESMTDQLITYERIDDVEALPVKASGVTLDQTTLTKTVGDEDVTLVATVAPADAADKTVTWSTSDEAVATVDTTGKVSFVGAGTATITAKTANGKTAACAVTVVAAGTEIVEVESVVVPASLKAHLGVITIDTTVLPTNATNKTVTYTSSAPTIVSVETDEETGVQTIKALKPGTAVITATAGGKTANCAVTVVTDYCLVGSSASPAFGGTSWKVDYSAVADVPTGILFTQDAEDATKYTLDIDLYVGSSIKIINVGATGWNTTLTLNLGAETDGFGLVNTATEATSISAATGDASKNIGVTNDGKYRLTLTVPETGDPTLSYQYLEEAAELGLKLDIRIKGGYNTNWSPTDLCYEGLNPEQLTTGTYTATFTVKYVGEDAADFGIYTTASGADSQLGWGRDDVTVDFTGVTGITDGASNWSITAGVYKFTVTVDPTGTFTAISIESGATEDENTVVIGTPATPAE